MKRVLGIALALISMGFVVSADAKTSDVSKQNSTVAASSAAPQWGYDRYGQRRYDRRNDRRWDRRNNRRSVTRSRYVRYGRRLYRETYLVTYWSNGRTNTRLISRQRVG
ncbi:MAG TPA: hypothetical protein VFR12_10405 [Pyrinomonadaceae bacterium]|nr:hypothetical protein [Pyrinomonadaceae bacterium]